MFIETTYLICMSMDAIIIDTILPHVDSFDTYSAPFRVLIREIVKPTGFPGKNTESQRDVYVTSVVTQHYTRLHSNTQNDRC